MWSFCIFFFDYVSTNWVKLKTSKNSIQRVFKTIILPLHHLVIYSTIIKWYFNICFIFVHLLSTLHRLLFLNFQLGKVSKPSFYHYTTWQLILLSLIGILIFFLSCFIFVYMLSTLQRLLFLKFLTHRDFKAIIRILAPSGKYLIKI